jgi:hypothetical protein
MIATVRSCSISAHRQLHSPTELTRCAGLAGEEVGEPQRAEAGLLAMDAGAEVEIPVQEMFWGERYGVLRDPYGHRWVVSTAREQLTPDDIARRTPPEI